MILESSPVSNLIPADKRVDGALGVGGRVIKCLGIMTACSLEGKGRGLSSLS